MTTFLHPFARVGRPQSEMINIVSGEGVYITDDTGKRYIDAMGALWFQNIGYGRSDMADAIADAARRIGAFHTFEKYTNPMADELAERIAGLAPMDQPRVTYTSSGSEAVEAAVKFARLAQTRAGHPERTVVMSRERSYHGITLTGTSAGGMPANKEGFGPLGRDFVNVPADEIDDLKRACVEYSGKIAAIITEPVQGAGGVYPPPPGYLQGLRDLADEHGAFLIFDEVITGFGRLGHWFGADRFGVVPDIITFAKAVTSGYVPLGGVILGHAVLEPLVADPDFVLRHGHTYCGHPVAMAAALTNIGILESEGLLDRADGIGEVLGRGLNNLVADGLAVEVRGVGAIWALKLPEELDAVAIRDAVEQRGVITRPLFGSICFCPPLVITDQQLEEVIGAVADSLRARRV